VTYGAEERDAAKRFWTDSGLGVMEETGRRKAAETPN
jgi:hypothetical protein